MISRTRKTRAARRAMIANGIVAVALDGSEGRSEEITIGLLLSRLELFVRLDLHRVVLDRLREAV